MESFTRWNAVLGLVGSVVVGSSLLGAMKALALPEDQILKKLHPVPLFTLTDSQGAPLVKISKEPVAGAFLYQKDAQNFLDDLKIRTPEAVKDVRVIGVPMSDIYKLNQKNQNDPNELAIAYVPNQSQVRIAIELMNKRGNPITEFYGVPIFTARIKDKGYLTIQRGNEQVIPFFFQHEELEEIVARLKQQQPNLASSIEIQVSTLEATLKTMRERDTPEIQRVILVPPKESLAYIRSRQSVSTPSTPASSGSQ